MEIMRHNFLYVVKEAYASFLVIFDFFLHNKLYKKKNRVLSHLENEDQ